MRPTEYGDRDQLKDALWNDSLFVSLVSEHGMCVVYTALWDFRKDLAAQLAERTGPERWRRSTEALIIRVKARLRLLERIEREA